MKYYLIILLFIGHQAVGQSAGIDSVIRKISGSQVEKDAFYDSGLFPSQRYWLTSRNGVEDNNIFFTASIVYILKQLLPKLDAANQVIVQDIIRKTYPLYILYANRNGDVTHNFWQTIPPDLPFPNGKRILSREKYRLPDDLDDTCLVQLAKEPDDESDFLLRKKMLNYAGRATRKEVKNTLDKYKNYQAYETLFAKKMDQEYDLVVMSNALLFVFKKGYNLQFIDLQTIELIKQAIREDDHIEEPVMIAPYYMNTSIILYHWARLIANDPGNRFEDVREKIIADIQKRLEVTKDTVEQLMLLSSLYKLGKPQSLVLEQKAIASAMTEFVFFQFKPQNLLPFDLIPPLKWRCEAFNRVLLLEYLVLQSELSE